jgi:hypothetical protein
LLSGGRFDFECGEFVSFLVNIVLSPTFWYLNPMTATSY